MANQLIPTAQSLKVAGERRDTDESLRAAVGSAQSITAAGPADNTHTLNSSGEN